MKLPASARGQRGGHCSTGRGLQPWEEWREQQREAIKTSVVDVGALCPCPNVPHQPFSGKLVIPVVCTAVGDSGYIIVFLQEEDFQKTQKS